MSREACALSIVGVLALCLVSILLAVYSGYSKGRKRALRYAMLPKERRGKLSRAAPFPRLNSNLSAGFAKFLHQHRVMVAFKRAVFPDLVGQLREFCATVLVLNNCGALVLAADVPLSDGTPTNED